MDLRQLINESIAAYERHPLKGEQWCEPADFVLEDMLFLEGPFTAELQFGVEAAVTISYTTP